MCNDKQIYQHHLKRLNEKNLTKRQVDIMSCIVFNRGSKKISSILNLSHHTVNSHINSLYLKLGFNSREQIIDFVEKSGKFKIFKKYYSLLQQDFLLKNTLDKIKSINRQKKYIVVEEVDKTILQQWSKVREMLLSANIDCKTSIESCRVSASIECLELNKNTTSTKNYENAVQVTLLFNIKEIDQTTKIRTIFFDKQNYRLKVIELITVILHRDDVSSIAHSFFEEYSTIQNLSNELEPIAETVDENNKYAKLLPVLGMIFLLVATAFYGYNNLYKYGTEKFVNNSGEKSWGIPTQFEYYVERSLLLEKLWHALDSNKNSKITGTKLLGIYGISGVGKTLLTTQMIHSASSYKFKGFFHAEDKTVLEKEYIALGEKYNLLNNRMTNEYKVKIVKEWMSDIGSSIVVYDDVQNMSEIFDYIPSNSDIIVVSKYINVKPSVEVELMSKNESFMLIKKLLSNTQQLDAEELAAELGYLPLAISQACFYILANNINIQDYLLLYKKHRNELLSKNELSFIGTHQPLYSTLEIAFGVIQQYPYSQEILSLLHLISCCNNENIPKRLLKLFLTGKEGSNNTEFEFNQYISVLKKYSLIQDNVDSVSVHRLVHLWIQDKTVQTIKNLQRLQEALLLTLSTSIINKNYFEINCLCSHIRTFLKNYESELTVMQNAELLSALGRGYMIIGNYKDALLFLKKALGFRNNASLNVVDDMYNIGVTCLYTGSYKESKEYLEKFLSLRKKTIPKLNIELADTYKYLGIANLNIGNYKISRDLLKKSKDIKLKHLGSDNVDVLEYLGIMSGVFGEYEKGKHYLERCLKHKLRMHKEDTLDIANTYYQLGKLYRKCRKYRNSKLFLDKALAIRRKYFAEDNIEVSHVLHQLGITYRCIGSIIKSDVLLNEALHSKLRYFGESSVDVAYSYYQLSINSRLKNEYKKAESLLEKALQIMKEHLGELNLETNNVLYQLGILYRELGNYDKSIEFLNKVYQTRVDYYGKSHIEVGCAAYQMALSYGKLNNDIQKIKYLNISFEIFKYLDKMDKLQKHSFLN